MDTKEWQWSCPQMAHILFPGHSPQTRRQRGKLDKRHNQHSRRDCIGSTSGIHIFKSLILTLSASAYFRAELQKWKAYSTNWVSKSKMAGKMLEIVAYMFKTSELFFIQSLWPKSLQWHWRSHTYIQKWRKAVCRFVQEREHICSICHQNVCPHSIARHLCYICGNCFNVSPLGQHGLSWGSCCNLIVRWKWTGAEENLRKVEANTSGSLNMVLTRLCVMDFLEQS